MGEVFERLLVWRDEVRRSGAENMAVDQWLLETVGARPVLRIYEWDGDWASFGYFQGLAEVRHRFAGQGVELVRRATGGGIVDHRIDRTYTLVVPGSEAVARQRGAGIYRLIHEALVEALGLAGTEAVLLARDGGSDSEACFERPVAWDVVDSGGRKVAGAGQRRTRRGLLHQGSVVAAGLEALPDLLAAALAREVDRCDPVPDREAVGRLVEQRFGNPAWLARR